MTARSDSLLMTEVARGSEDAFATFFSRHRAVVLGYLVKLLRDRTEAEDVLQDVFVGAWQNARSFCPDRGSVRGWLFVMARSKALDRLRARNTRQDREADSGRFAVKEEQPTTEEQLIVSEALAALDVKQRVCVELAFFSGCSQTQIASKLGVPLGTVKSRFLAGMRRLRENMVAT